MGKYIWSIVCTTILLPIAVCGQDTIDYRKISFNLLAYSPKDTPMRGTGFVIQNSNNYYLVTASHVFQKPSPGYTRFKKISFYNSFDSVKIFRDTLNNKLLHKQELRNTKTKKILYSFYPVTDSTFLDIAVLKLETTNEIIRKSSLTFASLSPYLTVTDRSEARIFGFPARIDSPYYLMTKVFNDRGLRDSKLIYIRKHFFDVLCEPDLGGLSGAPIFLTFLDGTFKVSGIFISQYNDGRPLGFGVFAAYIIEIISKIEGIPYSKFKPHATFKNNYFDGKLIK